MILEKYKLERYKALIIPAIMVLIVITIISLTLGKSVLQGKAPSIASFIIINFSGYLFFLLIPVEVMIPYYLSQGHPGWLLVILAVTTATIAHIIDYSIGHLFSDSIIDKLIGRWRYKKAEKAINRYGDWAVFTFALFPISSPILMLAAGMVRMKLPRTLLFSVSGLTLKYLTIVYIFGWL